MDSARVALTAAGVDTPRLDAELLLAEALGVDRTRLYLDRDLAVRGPAVRRFQELVRRRAVEREPVAYLLGRKGFRRLELAVDRRVLVPRPETELLVELAVAELPRGARVVDVGTGSGAVALALADERPDLEVAGSDVSADALEVARANGERLGARVRWLRADGLPEGDWDAVVANLPYVEAGAALAPEIARHEPPGALFGGEDGLDVIRAVVDQAAAARVGWIALEHGAGQGAAVRMLLALAGWASVRTERDLAGHERVTVGC
ncbi:MAG: peptide chain release factor N(5)-glutamine methyltransferase [Solirubrobacteraceae bacterium]|nr:peptide chain release factor N(5)-glutamine methyltransferase [Solirubrobacteraceae bacterium]